MLVFFAFLLFSSSLFAQEVSQSIDLSISSNPQQPAPGGAVTLEAVSYGLDLSQATLTWTYGGKTILSGLGKTRASVIAPASGMVASVVVTASAPGVSPVSATLVLRPGSIDLLWEGANSSTPPFYKGRPLLSAGGFLRVVAIPAPGAPRQPSFQWSRNDSAVPSASGLGQSSIVVEHTAFETAERISVSATGGGFEGNAVITVPPRRPAILAYQKKDGFIDFSYGSEQLILATGTGTILRFEPFFFSTANGSLRDLLFDMKIDDTSVFGDRENELGLSRPANGGSGEISVTVSPRTYSLQRTNQLFEILFQ